MNEAEYGKRTQWVEDKLDQINGLNWVVFGPLAKTHIRQALFHAITFGTTLIEPSFPPDSKRIADLEAKLALQEEINRLGKAIITEKDTMVTSLKDKVGDIEQVRTQLRTVQQGNRAELDRLAGVIQRQQQTITALQSDPTNEEARFNIEQQYEREFTSTSHLMQEKTRLEAEIAIQDRHIRSLEDVRNRYFEKNEALTQQLKECQESDPQFYDKVGEEFRSVAGTIFTIEKREE